MSAQATLVAHGVPLAAVSLRERIRLAPTPSRLKGFMYATWGIAALLLFVGAGMLWGAWQALKTVGKDAAPSIIAAQEISSALADLDANAANYLLGSRVHQAAAAQTFEKQRLAATSNLVKAAQNITYGEAESVPINALFDGLGRYLELYAEMRYRKDSGDAAGAQLVYGTATDLMHQRMLPAADELDKANYAWLNYEYQQQRLRSEGAEIIAGIVAAALVAVLVWAQIFLRRRTRRVFNVPLLAATVVAAAFGVYLVSRIAVAREDLRIAKDDAFESIHALWQARAVAYDANGDESRYLLGGARAAAFDQAYKDKVHKLATVSQPSDVTIAKLPKDYQGFFATELRNITFPGELDAARRVIHTFAAYDKLDGQMRAIERAGRHAAAVELCIGLGADQSNAAFESFDKALREVIAINHKEFNATVDSGQRTLLIAAVLLPFVSLLVVFLALFGIRPRLREYAA